MRKCTTMLTNEHRGAEHLQGAPHACQCRGLRTQRRGATPQDEIRGKKGKKEGDETKVEATRHD